MRVPWSSVVVMRGSRIAQRSQWDAESGLGRRTSRIKNDKSLVGSDGSVRYGVTLSGTTAI